VFVSISSSFLGWVVFTATFVTKAEGVRGKPPSHIEIALNLPRRQSRGSTVRKWMLGH